MNITSLNVNSFQNAEKALNFDIKCCIIKML